MLMSTLKRRPPMSDAFGRGDRLWLAELELPVDERETVDGFPRRIDFLNAEIAILERGIAEHALHSDHGARAGCATAAHLESMLAPRAGAWLAARRPPLATAALEGVLQERAARRAGEVTSARPRG